MVLTSCRRKWCGVCSSSSETGVRVCWVMRDPTRTQQRSTILPPSVGSAWTTPPTVPTWRLATSTFSLLWNDTRRTPFHHQRRHWSSRTDPGHRLLPTGGFQATEAVGQLHQCRWGLCWKIAYYCPVPPTMVCISSMPFPADGGLGKHFPSIAFKNTQY
jgi:hypothetical protein